MKKIAFVAMLAGTALFSAVTGAFASTALFTDTQGKWYEDAVYWAKNKGIMNGVSDDLFGGDMAVTRGQLAQVMKNMEAQGLLGNIGQLQSQITQMKNDNSNLQSRVEYLAQQITTLQQKDHDITKLQNNVDDLNKKNAQMMAEFRLPYMRGFNQRASGIKKLTQDNFNDFRQGIVNQAGSNVVSVGITNLVIKQQGSYDSTFNAAINARNYVYINYDVSNVNIDIGDGVQPDWTISWTNN